MCSRANGKSCLQGGFPIGAAYNILRNDHNRKITDTVGISCDAPQTFHSARRRLIMASIIIPEHIANNIASTITIMTGV